MEVEMLPGMEMDSRGLPPLLSPYPKSHQGRLISIWVSDPEESSLSDLVFFATVLATGEIVTCENLWTGKRLNRGLRPGKTDSPGFATPGRLTPWGLPPQEYWLPGVCDPGKTDSPGFATPGRLTPCRGGICGHPPPQWGIDSVGYSKNSNNSPKF